jgi:hypothetical protein
MSKKWESESLRWIHAMRNKGYLKTKGKPLTELPIGPSKEAKALAKKLRLKRVPLRAEGTPAASNKRQSS